MPSLQLEVTSRFQAQPSDCFLEHREEWGTRAWRACQPTSAGCRFKLCLLLSREMESLDQQEQCGWLRSAVHAALQTADSTHAQSRALGQRFLCQANHNTVAPEQSAKGEWEWSCHIGSASSY
jgi:hypothetical protein